MGKLEAGDRCGCASEGLKTFHRSTFSLDRTMVLFNDVVEIFATAYLYVFPIDVFFSEQTQRPMAGFVAIKRHFFRQSPGVGCNGLAKKGFCRKVGFFEQNRKTGTINSMTYRIPNSSKTNFATEPVGTTHAYSSTQRHHFRTKLLITGRVMRKTMKLALTMGGPTILDLETRNQ